MPDIYEILDDFLIGMSPEELRFAIKDCLHGSEAVEAFLDKRLSEWRDDMSKTSGWKAFEEHKGQQDKQKRKRPRIKDRIETGLSRGESCGHSDELGNPDCDRPAKYALVIDNLIIKHRCHMHLQDLKIELAKERKQEIENVVVDEAEPVMNKKSKGQEDNDQDNIDIGHVEERQPYDSEWAADELLMYLDSDSDLYHQQFLPMLKNVARKIKRGIYDPKQAPKLWMYLVDAAAKKYYAEGLEHQDIREWNKAFPKQVREKVAQEIAKREYEKIKNGEYSTFLNREKINMEPKEGSVMSDDADTSPLSRVLGKLEKESQYKGTQNRWDVYLDDEMLDSVFFDADMEEDQVKRSLVDHDGYDPGIEITKEPKKKVAGGLEREGQEQGRALEFEELPEEIQKSFIEAKLEHAVVSIIQGVPNLFVELDIKDIPRKQLEILIAVPQFENLNISTNVINLIYQV